MKLGWCHMSHVTSRSCDGMWNMKHEEWCHKWCHMEKGYKHGKSYLNQGLRYIFRIIKAWRPCEWQKGINKIENKRIMRIKKRYSWIYLTGKWIPYKSCTGLPHDHRSGASPSTHPFALLLHWTQPSSPATHVQDPFAHREHAFPARLWKSISATHGKNE